MSGTLSEETAGNDVVGLSAMGGIDLIGENRLGYRWRQHVCSEIPLKALNVYPRFLPPADS